MQVDRDLGEISDAPQFPMHPSHEFPPGVKRLAVRLGFGPNRLDAGVSNASVTGPPGALARGPGSLGGVPGGLLPRDSRPATPRIVGSQVPSLPLARVTAAVARRSSAQAVEDIKHTARLLFEQISEHPRLDSARSVKEVAAVSGSSSVLASPSVVAAFAPATVRRSPSAISRSPRISGSPAMLDSPRPQSVRGQINEAFIELSEMRRIPIVTSQPPTPGGKMLLKVGELLYDPENDRYFNSSQCGVGASGRLDYPNQ